MAFIKDNYKNLKFDQSVFLSVSTTFRKVKRALPYVERTHPTDCVWIYIKEAHMHNPMH